MKTYISIRGLKYLSFAITLMCLSTLSALATNDLPLDKLGRHINLEHTDIRWQVPILALPKKMTVYRIVASDFSYSMLSNLVVIGGFSQPNQALETLRPAMDGRSTHFQGNDGKWINISPMLGYIRYGNRSMRAVGPSTELPSERTAVHQAVTLLNRLGIAETNLLHDISGKQIYYDSMDLTETFMPHNEGVLQTNVLRRGVRLYRVLAGASCSGLGDSAGATVEFVDYGALSSLTIVWPNVVPSTSQRIASQEEISEMMKQGRAVISSEGDDLDTLGIPKKLRITQATPMYFICSVFDRQKFVYPYLLLKGVADFGFTNSVVELDCPVFYMEPLKAARKHEK